MKRNKRNTHHRGCMMKVTCAMLMALCLGGCQATTPEDSPTEISEDDVVDSEQIEEQNNPIVEDDMKEGGVVDTDIAIDTSISKDNTKESECETELIDKLDAVEVGPEIETDVEVTPVDSSNLTELEDGSSTSDDEAAEAEEEDPFVLQCTFSQIEDTEKNKIRVIGDELSTCEMLGATVAVLKLDDNTAIQTESGQKAKLLDLRVGDMLQIELEEDASIWVTKKNIAVVNKIKHILIRNK